VLRQTTLHPERIYAVLVSYECFVEKLFCGEKSQTRLLGLNSTSILRQTLSYIALWCQGNTDWHAGVRCHCET